MTETQHKPDRAEPLIYITALQSEQLAAAKALSMQYGWPLAQTQDDQWALQLQPDKLVLRRADGLAYHIDFLHGKAAKHAREADLSRQPLARAMGLRAFKKRFDRMPVVADVTAGFAQDAWLIAALGCHVHLVERLNVLYEMQNDARRRVLEYEPGSLSSIIAGRMLCHLGYATQWLQNTSDNKPDIVYLDPMYPATNKKALVNKGMQILHDLAGPDHGNEALLAAALATAQYRVIVKRPKGAPHIVGSDAWGGQLTTINSPATRFDVYHVTN